MTDDRPLRAQFPQATSSLQSARLGCALSTDRQHRAYGVREFYPLPTLIMALSHWHDALAFFDSQPTSLCANVKRSLFAGAEGFTTLTAGLAMPQAAAGKQKMIACPVMTEGEKVCIAAQRRAG